MVKKLSELSEEEQKIQKEYHKKYYQANKDKLKEMAHREFTCEHCGKTMKYCHKVRHQNTKKCQLYKEAKLYKEKNNINTPIVPIFTEKLYALEILEDGTVCLKEKAQ